MKQTVRLRMPNNNVLHQLPPQWRESCLDLDLLGSHFLLNIIRHTEGYQPSSTHISESYMGSGGNACKDA